MPCEDRAAALLALLGGIIALVLFLVFGCCWVNPCKRVPQAARVRWRKQTHHFLAAMRAPTKQMISFYQACRALIRKTWPLLTSLGLAQIVTRVETVFAVSMPASVAALLDVFEGLNLSLDAFGLPMGCLQLASFFDRLLFVMLAPYVLALLIAAWCTTTEALTVGRSSTLLTRGLLRALPYLLMLFFLAFPMVSSLAFQVLACTA